MTLTGGGGGLGILGPSGMVTGIGIGVCAPTMAGGRGFFLGRPFGFLTIGGGAVVITIGAGAYPAMPSVPPPDELGVATRDSELDREPELCTEEATKEAVEDSRSLEGSFECAFSGASWERGGSVSTETTWRWRGRYIHLPRLCRLHLL
jgi:hypothetical protein